jgi:hypothetical protein
MRLGQYELRLKHDSYHGYTTASLYGGEPDPIVTAQAVVAYDELDDRFLDQFSRKRGRVVAFTKLLRKLTAALPTPQARQERTRLWEEYFRAMPQDRGQRPKYTRPECVQIAAILRGLSPQAAEFMREMLAR